MSDFFVIIEGGEEGMYQEWEERRRTAEIGDIEELMPKDDLLRKIDATVDFCSYMNWCGDYIVKIRGGQALTRWCW